MLNKNRFYIIIGISILIFCGWLCIYFIQFHGTLSVVQSDWGNFSTYLTAIITFISLIILSFLTYIAHRESTEIKIRLEKPVLVFTFDVNSGHYYCSNIGKGAAMNVLIIHKLTESQNNYNMAVKCYSLAANDKIFIKWIKGTFELDAIYYDISDNIYVSRFFHDRMVPVLDKIELNKIDVEIKSLNGQGEINNFLGNFVSKNERIYTV